MHPSGNSLAYEFNIYICSLTFIFSHTFDMWRFPSQGLNPSHSCHLSNCCCNAGSLTHCAMVGTPPLTFVHFTFKHFKELPVLY